MDGLEAGDDGLVRCRWCVDHDDYRHYHDREWGVPSADDNKLFEKICLEGFQAGLSWLTILRKRENFRAAFAGFIPEIVAGYGPDDVERLLTDAGIVRHRGKIESVINNARCMLAMRPEVGSLAAFVWQFEPAVRPATIDANVQAVASTDASRALSRALKNRHWRFVGPTTCHAFMQSMGMVNDHVEGCFRRPEIEALRASFRRPDVVNTELAQ